MSRNRRPRRPNIHDYRVGELVTLASRVAPLDAGEVVQVSGFKGTTQLRLLPIGGLPVVAHFELVTRTDLPCGSEKPPHRHRRFQKRRRASDPAPASRDSGDTPSDRRAEVARP